MHPILSDHPDYKREIIDRRERLAAARRKFTERQGAERMRYFQAKAKYDNQLREATLNGTPPPQPPEPIQRMGDEQVLFAEKTVIDQAEKDWLAAHADELGQALDARRLALIDSAADAAALLHRVAAEVTELHVTAQRVHRGTGPTTRRTAVDILHAASPRNAPSPPAPTPVGGARLILNASDEPIDWDAA